MKLKTGKYVTDSSALITAFNTYYAPEFSTIFWDELGKSVRAQDVVIVRHVYRKVRAGFEGSHKHPPDELLRWIEAHRDFVVDTDDDEGVQAE